MSNYPYPHDNPSEYDSDERRRVCPRCEGNGTSEFGDGACGFCGGSGWDPR